jgi:hypothetical protein
LSTAALLTAWIGFSWGDDNPKKVRADITKSRVIEKPVAKVVTDSAVTEDKNGAFVNPKVEPGAVKWHATFDEACKASAKSGKPVLLFQMMGHLDQKFC